MEYANEFVRWLGELERPFAFLLSIPFLVVAAGVISHLVRGDSHEPDH